MLPADGRWRNRIDATGVHLSAHAVMGLPGARTACGGKHHAPFGQIRKRERGAGRFALAADRPAACLQGIEQHARLGGAHGKFRDADRKAG